MQPKAYAKKAKNPSLAIIALELAARLPRKVFPKVIAKAKKVVSPKELQRQREERLRLRARVSPSETRRRQDRGNYYESENQGYCSVTHKI